MKIEIWAPRWHDRVVLIAKHKVRESNEIVFTKTKQYEGKTFQLSGETIKQYPLCSNGRIQCYEVPLDLFD